eukprot:6853679-Ditylum_brightwellii.AAC.1
MDLMYVESSWSRDSILVEEWIWKTARKAITAVKARSAITFRPIVSAPIFCGSSPSCSLLAAAFDEECVDVRND